MNLFAALYLCCVSITGVDARAAQVCIACNFHRSDIDLYLDTGWFKASRGSCRGGTARRRVRYLTKGTQKNPSHLRRRERSHIIPSQDAAEAFNGAERGGEKRCESDGAVYLVIINALCRDDKHWVGVYVCMDSLFPAPALTLPAPRSVLSSSAPPSAQDCPATPPPHPTSSSSPPLHPASPPLPTGMKTLRRGGVMRRHLSATLSHFICETWICECSLRVRTGSTVCSLRKGNHNILFCTWAIEMQLSGSGDTVHHPHHPHLRQYHPHLI